MANDFSNVEIGNFYDKSEGAIRHTRKTNPKLFEAMTQYYSDEKSKETKGKTVAKSIFIALLNFKGGVGKSTIANLLQASTVGSSVIINTDDQDANMSNASEAVNLFELEEDGVSLKDAIDAACEEFDTIIVDTPGEVAGPVADMIALTRNFIIPVIPGRRSISYTKDTIDAFFALYENPKKARLCFVVNNFIDEEERQSVEEVIRDHISSGGYEDRAKYMFTQINHSKAIRTMEDRRASIKKLSTTNAVAYNVAKKRIDKATAEIKAFFGIE
ncbi:ParA family protein [Thiomicrolovo sp. ZZH C-3]